MPPSTSRRARSRKAGLAPDGHCDIAGASFEKVVAGPVELAELGSGGDCRVSAEGNFCFGAVVTDGAARTVARRTEAVSE